MLHPVIVHFSIATLAIAVVSDFLYLLSKKQSLWDMSNYLLGLGTIFAIGAVLTGQQAIEIAKIPPQVEDMVYDHRDFGQMTMWIFIALSLMRVLFIWQKLFRKRIKWIYYGLALLGLVLLFRTGLVG
ncbi:DUF2231 domain-containing protein, partial [Candidatus Saccharibacteria bacterium]|nr:DUF2231 domain-containing protein [Candidatus Saccharibacteria bacterium]NIV03570.1 DUF2231 domain-containing protein [Calditrichia bacterium]NIV71847.1 DUF2231 domain-containing protein [Calditrichia bacterium]NIV98593.1 DUF2231 domain-containing protein [Candidatus Saccharibacteria bacterium]NIW78848.1 DUF2231 domain-containing protein [Calditrichia bacterium]